MIFTSFAFIGFFALVLTSTRWVFKSNRAAKMVLLAASYYFYGCWDYRFCLLMLVMTIGNAVLGHRIAHRRTHAKAWMWASVGFNLSILGAFKYFGFFIENLNTLLEPLGLSAHALMIEWILPVGISFYTFQCLSYCLDIYRGDLKPARSFWGFALFVSFFPQLVAGPIVRAKDFLPQLDRRTIASDQELIDGALLFLKGVIKKVLLADLLAKHWVNPAFQQPELFSSGFIWMAVIGYSLQIYLDFSAYTDMARGVAKILGYQLPVNFRRPYQEQSISEFWQRWHISMSSFFRDYLFFGLGGSRNHRTYRNLMITFIAIGVWHGAGWNFILYGALHGALVCYERYCREHDRSPYGDLPSPWLNRLYLTVWVFLLVVLLRVIFRAPEMEAPFIYFQF
jgi:alginate O-acetyltransferase complex protein AlgI